MPNCNELIQNIGTKPILASNLGFGEQGYALSKLKSALFVCPSITQAKDMCEQLNSLNKKFVLLDDFGKNFTLSLYSSNEQKTETILALCALCENDAIFVSTPKILLTFLPQFSTFSQHILTFETGKDYDLNDITKSLSSNGYHHVESVTMPGEFAKRGDIIDIFEVGKTNPVRLDFFDTNLEQIYTFDFISFEKKEKVNSIKIAPNKLLFLTPKQTENLQKKLSTFVPVCDTFNELLAMLNRNEDIPLEFLEPFLQLDDFSNLKLPIIISNEIEVETIFNKTLKEIKESIASTFKDEKLKNLYLSSKIYQNFEIFLKTNANSLTFFENFDISSTDLKQRLKNICVEIDFKTIKFPSFLFNLDELKTELTKFPNKQIFLCLSSQETLNSIKNIFKEKAIPFTLNVNENGIILTTLNFPFNICFEDDTKIYIGSTNFAHKKSATGESKTTIKYLPKAGEYVVHNVHGIGQCLGVVSMSVSGVDKEFFKIIYRGGDCVYVPYENADCLSLYMAEGGNVALNKLGGKEFATQKQRALQSIEDMSQELLELYAKRKATKGFKYLPDDYLYTEFENSFPYQETADQLQAIADVKRDMESGKVMDRLICGDVGFGKTEVAMRGLFKAVESGKQVAILAPTTILSMQHYVTATERTKNFGVKVEMLNRFKTKQQQTQILKDLKDGKINVICGTHRLLSDDVKFENLGLLILDEEQRFGVKAKEHIKQMKNNVDVLTLSATPIPRTLSMSLMTIRDISIINTAPTNRLPVKTYVLGYNKDIICNAINDEVNRGGQVLVVFNNVAEIYKLAAELKQNVNNPKAIFDVAHGQMSEIALENAVKRLYDKETNVFVSTTLIENGIDLPKANTLIVVDSDRLGLSQMYQLRGRVGRNNEQAYAYFTFNKNKTLTEDAANRLQAIAENTDLGSGFKIAMRDLQIRGAGELLGKVQHGHMLKIGYDMYSKLLNETLRKLKGEKVETEREVKIEIAITSKIPVSFVEDESERLKIIAKISNIASNDDARRVLGELMVTYGKLPHEIYQLTNVALLKSLAVKQKVKNIALSKTKMTITYYEDVDVNSLIKKVNKFSRFKFENTALPTICLSPSEFSVQTAQTYLLEFLNSK